MERRQPGEGVSRVYDEEFSEDDEDAKLFDNQRESKAVLEI